MRRRKAQEKEILPDPKYNSVIVGKFINMVMLAGKKSLAEKMVYGAFDVIKKQLNDQDAIKVFHKALDNARPRLEVKTKKGRRCYVSGSNRSKTRAWNFNCIALDKGFRKIKKRKINEGEVGGRDYCRIQRRRFSDQKKR